MFKCKQVVAKGSKAHSALSKNTDVNEVVCIESRRKDHTSLTEETEIGI